MDLVTLILMCSLAQSTSTNSMLYQIAQTSDADPTYIDDLTDGVVYTPSRIADASQMVSALVSAGHDIRVGVMQLPAREVMQSYSMTSLELVDSCRNVAVASDRLTQARHRYPEKDPAALSWYLTGDPKSAVGLSWALDVLAVEPVELQSKLGDVENPLPSRKYSRSGSLIFVEDRSENDSTSSSVAADSQSIVVGAEKKIVPKKWEPVTPTTSSSNASKARPSSQQEQPQPPVTDERLETSDELSTDAPQEGN